MTVKLHRYNVKPTAAGNRNWREREKEKPIVGRKPSNLPEKIRGARKSSRAHTHKLSLSPFFSLLHTIFPSSSYLYIIAEKLTLLSSIRLRYSEMTKPSKVRRVTDFHHHNLLSCRSKMCKKIHQKEKRTKSSEKKEWEGATCSVCMEHPHNAVLLLCSSYDKGCRPYMCATSCRFSNCLEQYKKAYTKVTSIEGSEPGLLSTDDPNCSSGAAGCLAGDSVAELLCPLCRGQVKGWTVVEPARKHLNAKKRTCMHENCSFVGTYKKLRKHVRREHPSACPLEVDPSLAEKWKKLEHERELNDVFSTIRSAMPGAIVMGDYVIEGNFGGLHRNFGLDDETLFRSEPYGSRWNDNVHTDDLFDDGYHSFDQDDFFVHHSGTEAASNVFNRISRLHSRLILGRSRRRQRHRASSRIR